MPSYRGIWPAVAVLALALSAARGATAQEAAAPPPSADSARAARAAKPGPDLITAQQYAGRNFATAYDIVEALRGNWLRARPSVSNSVGGGVTYAGQRRDAGAAPDNNGGFGTAGGTTTSTTTTSSTARTDPTPIGEGGGIMVYLDGNRLGSIEQLRAITGSTVAWIKRYSPIDAQGRFGPGHSSGVIFVSTSPDARP